MDIRDATKHKSKTFTFNGIRSSDLGLQVASKPDYVYPERDYEYIHVTGRNGDIVIPSDSYQNVDRSYAVSRGWKEGESTKMANAVVEWLHGASGYLRLEDDYEPEYYRLASYKSGGTITDLLQGAIQTEIVFNCQPQRYLKTGEIESQLGENTSIFFNQTNFVATPVIRAIWKSDSTVAGLNPDYSLRITSGERVTTFKIVPIDTEESYNYIIDCNIEDVYYSEVNKNSAYVYVEGKTRFPKLYPGHNSIEYDDSWDWFITPNYWTL